MRVSRCGVRVWEQGRAAVEETWRRTVTTHYLHLETCSHHTLSGEYVCIVYMLCAMYSYVQCVLVAYIQGAREA